MLNKVNYTSNETIISAENLNAIQDEIINNSQNLSNINNRITNLTAEDINALSKSGGSLSGSLIMNNNKISGLASPTVSTDATNKNYVDSKHFTTTTNISADWSGTNAPYTQVITVNGILATDMPHIAPKYSNNLEEALAQREAWQAINKATAENGQIIFTCFENKPNILVPIQIEVNR